MNNCSVTGYMEEALNPYILDEGPSCSVGENIWGNYDPGDPGQDLEALWDAEPLQVEHTDIFDNVNNHHQFEYATVPEKSVDDMRPSTNTATYGLWDNGETRSVSIEIPRFGYGLGAPPGYPQLTFNGLEGLNNLSDGQLGLESFFGNDAGHLSSHPSLELSFYSGISKDYPNEIASGFDYISPIASLGQKSTQYSPRLNLFLEPSQAGQTFGPSLGLSDNPATCIPSASINSPWDWMETVQATQNLWAAPEVAFDRMSVMQPALTPVASMNHDSDQEMAEAQTTTWQVNGHSKSASISQRPLCPKTRPVQGHKASLLRKNNPSPLAGELILQDIFDLKARSSKQSRTRRRFNPLERLEVAATRKEHACVICNARKIKVCCSLICRRSSPTNFS